MRMAAGLRLTCVPSCLLLLSLALAEGRAWAQQGAWTQIIPGNMSFHSLVWDGQRDRLVLSPGNSVIAPLVKTALELPLSGPPLWRELAEFPVQFGGGENCGMVLDPRREQVVFYDSYHNMVWTLPLAEGGEWRRLNVTGTLPLPRQHFTLILDEPRDRLVLYGGLGYGGNLRGEVWVLPLGEPTSWSQLDLPLGGPVARQHHAALASEADHADVRPNAVNAPAIAAAGVRLARLHLVADVNLNRHAVCSRPRVVQAARGPNCTWHERSV